MSNYRIILGLAAILFVVGCKKEPKESEEKKPVRTVVRHDFNADSAYYFVQKQVDFGPRVPGTKEHKSAAEWLEKKLGSYTDTIQVQTASATMYTGTKIPIYNIIGSFNPEAEDRILLAAHWDSRHIAEKDADESRKNEPILGANDGASGVGVLIELARQLQLANTEKGIDIIFFDAEDLGDPNNQETDLDWCLGSQHWSKNPHVANYTADYGILLDMVGAPDAVFTYEGYSYRYAAALMTKLWNNGIALGYDYLFVKKSVGGITDDHKFVIENLGIPMVDIIDLDNNRSHGHPFGHYHHTHKDNMDVIDKYTLAAVGETVLSVLME
ncbi:MAG: M28 family peptidase [Saprospiraceae bacterium]|nr:M28 family peptidase [Saprospiraceae bacterium]